MLASLKQPDVRHATHTHAHLPCLQYLVRFSIKANTLTGWLAMRGQLKSKTNRHFLSYLVRCSFLESVIWAL